MENICEVGKVMIMMLNICYGSIVLLFSFFFIHFHTFGNHFTF